MTPQPALFPLLSSGPMPMLLPAVVPARLPLDCVVVSDALAFLRGLPDASVDCVVTSPPYFGLRDYGVEGQIGLEPTPAEFVATMVTVFREVRRVLKPTGTVWLNLGDSYSSVGHKKSHSGYGTTGLAGGIAQEHSPLHRENNGTGKHKDLIGIPWRVAFGLQDDGWYLRSDIIWAKPNPMPESVTDRPTKAHEYVFLLTKSPRYFYDADAVREGFADERMGDPGKYTRTSQASKGANRDRQDTGFLNNGAGWDRGLELGGRNRRSVWTVATEPMSLSVQTSHLTRVASGDVSCGMMHIVMPDCSVHGGLFAQVARGFCGEHANDELIRILHNGSDPARELSPAALSTTETHNEHQPLDSWDSSRLAYFLAAIDRNIQIRKTGHAPATNSAYTPFSEILLRTDDKLELLASFVRHLYNRESNILPGEMDARLQDRIPHHIVDKFSLPISPDCCCLFYQKTTRDTSHFATFPRKLIEPMILAGSPENGVVLDMFMGSGTVALVARQHGRYFVGCDLNPEYVAIARERLRQPFEAHHFVKETKLDDLPLFAQGATND